MLQSQGCDDWMQEAHKNLRIQALKLGSLIPSAPPMLSKCNNYLQSDSSTRDKCQMMLDHVYTVCMWEDSITTPFNIVASIMQLSQFIFAINLY